MAEFTCAPQMLPALNTGHYPGASCEPQQGYHYHVEQRGQPRNYSGFNPGEHTGFDLHSIDTTPQSGFDQCFSPNPEENKYPESSTHGWNGKEVGRVNSYHYGRGAGHTPDYLYPRYDYVYSQGAEQTQNQFVASGSHTYQPYCFYNGVPMSGPNPTFNPMLPSMTYQGDVPFMIAMSNQRLHGHRCTTPKSLHSPAPIKEEPALQSVPAQLDPQPESPLIQCTFAYYEPPRPSEKKSTVKKKKPAMACKFCRVRKIACTPPVPGTAEVRCNQCARRDINCEYPKESKRGQYRRLQYLERVGKEVAEKIAEVERQSAINLSR